MYFIVASFKCFNFRAKDEKAQQAAMKIFYQAASKNKNKKRVKQCKYFLRVIYPVFCIVFILLFWIIGLFNYYK